MMKIEPDECPACHKSWVGDPIPEESQHLFGATHFRHEIGVETNRDAIDHWLCPFCESTFTRAYELLKRGSSFTAK